MVWADFIASSGGNNGGHNGYDIDALHNHEQIIPAKYAVDEKDCACNKPDHPS